MKPGFFFSIAVAFAMVSCGYAQVNLGDLHIDTTITGFKFAADFEGTHVFTKNGPSEIQSINPSAFSFTIATGLNADIATTQLRQLMDMSKHNGYSVSNILEKDTTLKGYSAHFISYTEILEREGYKNIVFNAFVIKGNTLILFTSGDMDNGRYIEKFKETFYSITL